MIYLTETKFRALEIDKFKSRWDAELSKIQTNHILDKIRLANIKDLIDKHEKDITLNYYNYSLFYARFFKLGQYCIYTTFQGVKVIGDVIIDRKFCIVIIIVKFTKILLLPDSVGICLLNDLSKLLSDKSLTIITFCVDHIKSNYPYTESKIIRDKQLINYISNYNLDY